MCSETKITAMLGVVFASLLAAGGAFGLTGSGDSAVGALETVRPTVDSISVPTEASIEATFSEPMLAPGATTAGNYAVSGLGAGTLATNPDSVSASGPYTLTWAAGEMQGGETVTVTATGVQDAVGNPIHPAGNSASATGVGVAPVFSGLIVDPDQAAAGETVSISFLSSEDLDGNPIVTVNGNPATFLSGTKATSFTYEYLVLHADPLGAAAIAITGSDLAGNLGSLSDSAALEIVEPEPELPLRWFPAALALLAAGMTALARKKRGLTQAKRGTSGDVSVPAFWFLLLAAMLLAPAALAQGPTVTNVAFLQQDNGAGGTEVVITYDLDAPNGPCDITVSLSKDGGLDGFSHAVTTVTGDLICVTTGTNRSITWDIAADYPDEDIPNAQIRVTADDGLALFTLTYTAGPNGSITGDSPQSVVEGNDGTPVTAVPDPGYHFVNWSDASTDNPRQDLNVGADINVTANFAINTYDITCNVVGNGTCVADPATVDHGDTSDITVTPASGSHLVSVLDSEEGSKPGSYTTTPVTANRTVTATFEINQYTLTYTAGSNGSITGDSPQTVNHGDDGTAVTAVPDPGYHFVDWSDGVLTATRQDTNVTADIDVSANFTFHLPEMIPVEACTFTMGRRDDGDDGTYGEADELPRHDVSLSAYEIGKFEVTNQQVCDVYNWANSQGYFTTVNANTAQAFGQELLKLDWSDCHIEYSGGLFLPETRTGLPGSTTYSMGDHPVALMNWYGAVAYCNWLSEIMGYTAVYDTGTWTANFANDGYHLSTEAQWERAAACDGSKHWIYGFISDTLTGKDRCNYYLGSGNWVNPLGLASHPYTSSVGWFDGANVSPNGNISTVDSPSPVGCYDMSGNAWEWCHDWYADTYYTTGGPPWIDPEGPATGSRRVLRGGSYLNSRANHRSAERFSHYPSTFSYMAFRLARDTGPKVLDFAINGGEASTVDPLVTLDNTCSGAPTEYMASEASDFSGATWETYDTAPSFTLSAGGGTKTVYFKVRNAAGESARVSDTIDLTERTILLPGDVPLVLVWVPSGSFQMGRYSGEQDSYSREDPQHLVSLAYGFWMGKYEVTQEQWLAVRGSWPGSSPSSSYGLGDSYPAYYISWNDAKDFITSLNTHIVSSGQGPLTVRLPSEAEWEYACRAGTQTRFYFGESLGCAGDCSDCAAGVMLGNRTDYMWYCGNNSPNGSKAVGGKLPNGFGLYDMSGNLYEWCEDDYHGSYTGAPADGSAWIDSPRASTRLIRGGYWDSHAWNCRSAYRNDYAPGNRYASIGFRLAAVATEVTSFAINSGAATTGDPEVTLDNTATGSPMEYMASESSDFSGAIWQPYDTAPSFTLSAGSGTKTVYFKVRNAAGESAPVSDTISFMERTILLPGDVPLELVWVPGGSFQMGRYPGEADSYAREDPQHPVTLGYGFWMGKYEVTQQQWLAVRGSWPGTAPSSSYGLGDSYPAYYISWDDAKDFITSLNAHIVSSGQGPLTVRLPSEAEWEYACRAGTQTRFYFGESLGCAGDCSDCSAGVLPGNRTDYMWYCGNNSPNGSKPVGTAGGTGHPNAFGLYDMSGNVYEWCEDDYHASYTGAPADGSAWIDSPRASSRMVRGGGWDDDARDCRSAARYHDTPGDRGGTRGFRLAAVQ